MIIFVGIDENRINSATLKNIIGGMQPIISDILNNSKFATIRTIDLTEYWFINRNMMIFMKINWCSKYRQNLEMQFDVSAVYVTKDKYYDIWFYFW